MKSSGLVVYWIASIVAALLFAVPGCALLIGLPHFTVEMVRLGYPTYFLAPFGLLKILAAITVLAPSFPRLKEWAYAGMVFDTIFAAYSRAATHDPLPQIILPLVIGAVALTSWTLRPVTRKL